jgi:predicted unusual protein kinase regulating ubiquinone biosynthesis (AarF/ABC1/UbiB family)
MRGGAMKLGQLASFVDLEFIPPEYRELYQSELAALRDQAPPVEWGDARRVLEAEWERPPESVLEDLEHEPVAAASIGQVHRATLPDGRRVAVKVQYPDVARAVETDVRSAMILLRGAKAISPGVDARAIAEELRERVLEELDYELEPANQREFARAYRGHPFAYVPDVVTELSRRRVLVTEWVDGEPFAAMRALGDRERDRIGEMLARFYFGAIDFVGAFNADPHPGNYLLRADGTMAFLDFGAVKRVSRAWREAQVRAARLYIAGDAVGLRDELGRQGYLPEPERFDPGLVMEMARLNGGRFLDDGTVRITPEIVRARVELMTNPRHEVVRAMRGMSLPAEDIWFHRLDLGVTAVLAQLRAESNWHRQAREWWFGDPPQTDLGRAEWAFFADRHLWRDPR